MRRPPIPFQVKVSVQYLHNNNVEPPVDEERQRAPLVPRRVRRKS
jgi:hypothetical protein